MTDSKKQKESWNLVGSAASVGGLVASISIVLSIIYDWGFFYALGISFGEAPTTIVDHVQSWLIWLPNVLLAAAAFLIGTKLESLFEKLISLFEKLISFFFRKRRNIKIEAEKSASKSSNSSQTQPIIKAYRILNSVLLVILGLLLIVDWFLFGDNFFQIIQPLWGIYFIWVVIAARIIIKIFPSDLGILVFKVIPSSLRRLAFNFLVYIPLLLLVVFLYGNISARSVKPDYLASIESIEQNKNNVSALETKNIKLVRSFENWLLIRDEKNRISWVHMNRVHNLVKLDKKQPFTGLIGSL